MYEYYIFPPHYDYFSIKYPLIEWKLMNIELNFEFNQFLYDNCKYLLIYHDSHFTEYYPIIIINRIDNKIKSIFEFMYNPHKNIGEIYNVCVDTSSRQQGYAKDLNYVFSILQNTLKCDLWIAVAFNNPMYKIVFDMYIKMGFIDDIKTNIFTPSKVYYEMGFTEMWKRYINEENLQ